MTTPPASKPADILIVDDEANIRMVLADILRREGFTSDQAADGEAGLALVKQHRYALVIMDLRMPRLDGMTALRQMKAHDPDITVVIITAHGTAKTALEAVEAGAYDYFTKPFDITEVRVVARRAMEKAQFQREITTLRHESELRYSFSNIIGQSSPMQDVYNLINRVTDNDVTVLITGESGTGKELIAAAIHHNSTRKNGPFIRVNTAAIPETLLESEMFGHERGSFTGAVAQKIGRFEAADGGTIFLDEIGDMPLSLQAKLLRVLQEKEIERVGSTKPIKVDIRVVCATHRDLARLVQENTFREDLYYRINVLPIFLPPLRERPEDIPLLLDFFIDRYNERLGRHIEGISRPALNVLLEYPWPGNVRELENIVQRMMLMAVTDMIDVSDLPPSIRGGKAGTPSTTGAPLPPSPLSAASPIVPGHPLAGFDFDRLLDIHTREPLADRLSALDDFVEKILIRQALEKTGGHRQESADLLGISRKSLHNKMVRHGLFDGDE